MTRSIRRVALVGFVVATFLGATVVPASAADVQIKGSGSSWAKNIIDQWVADLARVGTPIAYNGTSSGTGRQDFINGAVDFAQSEIPFRGDEAANAQAKGMNYKYLPIVAGGTALMYNVKDTNGRRITSLRLSPETIAKVFTGKVQKWDDPIILRDNPGLQPASQDIRVVARAEAAGTTALFTKYMSKTAPTVWAQFASEQNIPNDAVEIYPPNFGAYASASTSDGVANAVANESSGNGAITYVETSFAIARNFPVVKVQNASGNFVLPTSPNVATALRRAIVNPDNSFNLDAVYVSPDANAYPISSYSLTIVRTNQIGDAQGKTVSKYIYFSVCTGQQKAAPLGYSPIPEQFVDLAFAVAQQIPGHDPAPAKSDCRNPYLTGQGAGGGAGLPGSGGGDSASGGTSGAAGGTRSSSGTGAGGSSGTSGSSGATGSVDGGDLSADGLGADVALADDGSGGSTGGVALAAQKSVVELSGDSGSSWAFLAAALGLIAIVALPPMIAGAGASWRRDRVAATGVAPAAPTGPPPPRREAYAAALELEAQELAPGRPAEPPELPVSSARG